MDNYDIIISLTTWKKRLSGKNLIYTLKSLLHQNTSLKFKIVLTIFKDDMKYIQKDVQCFLNENNIEILVCNLDLKSHKKYFYVVQKYKSKPIILFDDDLIYKNDIVQTLYENYKKYPECISACRCRNIVFDKNGLAKTYNYWSIYDKKDNTPSFNLLATTGGGTLFPPNIINISKRDIPLIYRFLTADDIFLKYKMDEKNIKISCAYNGLSYKPQKESIDTSSLCFKNTCGEQLNNNYIKLANIKYREKNPEKIIISMTSWKNRIDKVYKVVQTILQGTVLPNKIILNLSKDEFYNTPTNLPKDLLLLEKISNIFEINWVEKNTKPYKKTIPTLEKYPHDIIITIDDDINYPLDFVEKIYYKFLNSDRKNPVTSGTNMWWGVIYSHAGGYSLIKNEMFGIFLNDLYYNLVKDDYETFKFADPIITYAILLNNKKYIYTENMNMTKIRKCTHDNKNSLSQIGTNKYKTILQREHELIQKYILHKYQIDIKKEIEKTCK